MPFIHKLENKAIEFSCGEICIHGAYRFIVAIFPNSTENAATVWEASKWKR